MTDSKAPWLARGSAIALMMAAGIALAACGAGGGLNEDEAAGLQQELKEAKAQAATDVAARVAAETQAAAALAAQRTAEAGKLKAEAEKTAAETAKTAADTARDAAVTDAQDAQKAAQDAAKSAQDAAAALVVAQAAEQKAKADQKVAEDEQAAAETALATAQRQLQTALAATTAEELRRQQAEAEQDRLAQVAEDAQQQVILGDARDARLGLAATTGVAAAGDPTVTPKYNAAADVTGTDVNFTNPTTGSLSGWFKSAFVKRVRSQTDHLEVYSNVENARTVPFRDSRYNVNDTIVDTAGMVVAAIDLKTDLRDDTASGAFPRQSGETTKSVNDRGITQDEFNTIIGLVANDTSNDGDIQRSEAEVYLKSIEDNMGALDTLNMTLDGSYSIDRQELNRYVGGKRFRDVKSFSARWEYVTGGTLGGASGTYRCAGDDDASAPTCTVRRSGSSFAFSDNWTFRPSTGTTGVRVEDSVYMYFGWWSRQLVDPMNDEDAWTFKAFHGPADSRVELAEITGAGNNDVTGTATYQGPAVGYYAIYEPAKAGSEHGAFTARATLYANFGSDPADDSRSKTVRGTIDQFSGHPDWSLSLESGNIVDVSNAYAGVNGADTDVIWSIGNEAAAAGDSWEASFYSNLVEDNPKTTTVTENAREGVMPSGIAGTFSATYDGVGRLTGAFGAHCVDVVCRP